MAGKLRKVKMLSRQLMARHSAMKAMLFKQDRQAHPLGIESELVNEGLQQNETC